MSDSDRALKEVRDQIPYSRQAGLYWFGKWLLGLSKEKKMSLFVSVLIYVFKLDFWDGYRSYIGGVGFIFTGLGAVLELAGNPSSTVATAGVLGGLGAICHGIEVIGKAGKADKQIEATKAAAQLAIASAPNPPTPTPEVGVGDAEIAKALGVVSSPTLNMTPVPTSTEEANR